jgi:hypothetical protein
MREQHANPAQPIPERQRLDFELGAVCAVDLRPNISFSSLLQVWVAVLEYDFGISDREAVLVRYPPSQDEGVVVEAGILRVYEQYLADLKRSAVEAFRRDFDAVFISRLLQHVTEREQGIAGGELVGLQNEFEAQIIDVLEWNAIGIRAGLQLWNTTGPGERDRLRCMGQFCRFFRDCCHGAFLYCASLFLARGR